jgi:hypothetical protein
LLNLSLSLNLQITLAGFINSLPAEYSLPDPYDKAWEECWRQLGKVEVEVKVERGSGKKG